MLIGFFKRPEKCNCCIVKYVDRVWLSEIGDADVLRTFIVKVNENSLSPLTEVRILIPHKYIKNIKIANETCFLPASEYYFNSPHMTSIQEYKIVQKPSSVIRSDNFGIINHDGIENIKIFASLDNYSSYQVGDCTVIRLQFPFGLEKGESTEIRLTFQIISLFTRTSSDENPVYFVPFSYFSPRYINEVDQLDKKLEIGVKPTLGEDKSERRIGGFDTIVYLPPEFIETSEFNADKKRPDPYNLHGKKMPEERMRLMFRLRSFLKNKGFPEDKLIGVGQDVTISGTITKRYDATKPLMLSIGEVDNKIRKSTLFSYFAIILSIISIIYNVFIK